jgi:hypothetical protein
MNHDPLCINYGGCDCWKCVTPCNCEATSKAQEDAHDCDSHGDSISISCGHWWSGYEYAIDKCIAAVVDMHQDGCGLYYGVINSCDCGIESAMRSLQEKP